MRGGRINLGGDVKSVGVEAGEVLITRVTDGAEDLEIVDRLEKIRLAVPVVADQRDTFGGETEIDALEVAEVLDRDALESDAMVPIGGGGARLACGRLDGRYAHVPLNSGARFSTNARVPSRMSAVAARRPK